ncbi:MAG: serine dehydratase subunit alpha family protein [Lachnospiraceae bacterium]|nr:serine dehydratase subunit alpha family protein [Lachnospiraceae bacterium]
MNVQIKEVYTEILKEQLIPAMGCTEPVSVAYGAARMRAILGDIPEEMYVQVSRNIIKNAKSVIVPHTGGLKGIEAAAAAGVIAGDETLELDVLSSTRPQQYQEIAAYLKKDVIRVEPLSTDILFDMIITGVSEGHQARVRISGHHTFVTYLEKDGEILLDRRKEAEEEVISEEPVKEEKPALAVVDILEYVREVPLEEIRDVIERQIGYNTAIAEEGLRGDYGANIGKVLLKSSGPDPSIRIRAKVMAAAGSDARMGGCEMPVIIVCGSGNQGITASLPVVEYAKAYQISDEQLIRAVALSDLMAVHVKEGIGTLSAFCGAVCSGCSAGAGIAYLLGGDDKLICHTFVNALAIVSGMICDGAKPSCAAKIAASVDAGILGYEMAVEGQEFYSGEGIVTKGIEGNIKNIGRLGRIGMKQTDEEIMNIMFNQSSC